MTTASNNSRILTPDLKEFMDRRRREFFFRLNCVSLGTIQSFDSTNQTAEIKVNFLKGIKGANPINSPLGGTSSDTSVEYPVLVNCPVFILNGGGGRITFPVAAGDFCLLLFCDKDIDRWLTTENVVTPPTDRSHDLNDAIALIGIHSLLKPLTSYDTSGVEIKYSNSVIALEEKIAIKVSTQTLRDALDSLCDALTAWVDTHNDTPNAGTLVLIAAAKAKIDAVLK